MNPKKTYIEVILPLPVEGSFTYSVPENSQEIVKGQRVVVQFGVRKLYTAIILDIHNKKPEGYLAKNILEVRGGWLLLTSLMSQTKELYFRKNNLVAAPDKKLCCNQENEPL